LLTPTFESRFDKENTMANPQQQHFAWSHLEGERAFAHLARSRRRASLLSSLLRRSRQRPELPVHDERTLARRAGGAPRVREIPVDAITGTVEPGRAREFDDEFRPTKRARKRWLGVWVAEHTSAGLPPIDVVRVGNAYAIRDGHHRVSVARARGALTIDAVVA
jgi:hypothetical protein